MPRTQSGNTQNPFGLEPDGAPPGSQMGAVWEELRQAREENRETRARLAALQQRTDRMLEDLEDSAPAATPAAPGRTYEAAAGPPAPPKQRTSRNRRIKAAFRIIVKELTGSLEDGIPVHEYKPPASARNWPTRVILGPDGNPVRTEKKLRFYWSESFWHQDNQRQVVPIARMMLRQSSQHGVPATMALDELLRILDGTFTYYKNRHKDGNCAEGQAKIQLNKERATLNSRKRRKRARRATALGLPKKFRYADGIVVPLVPANRDALRARRHKPRADLEFAPQNRAQSVEVDHEETMPNGENKVVWRPKFVLWRSKQLADSLHEAEKSVPTNKRMPTAPCQEVEQLPPSFRLPSTIRRWMVSSAFALTNPLAVELVSDNAGPFDDSPFCVAEGRKEWGSPIPVEDWPVLPDGSYPDELTEMVAAAAAHADQAVERRAPRDIDADDLDGPNGQTPGGDDEGVGQERGSGGQEAGFGSTRADGRGRRGGRSALALGQGRRGGDVTHARPDAARRSRRMDEDDPDDVPQVEVDGEEDNEGGEMLDQETVRAMQIEAGMGFLEDEEEEDIGYE